MPDYDYKLRDFHHYKHFGLSIVENKLSGEYPVF